MDDETVLGATGIEPEKTLTQSQVNDIVKREKAMATDRARKEYEALQAQQSQPMSMGGMPQGNMGDIEDKVFNRILEHAKKLEEDEQRKAFEDQRAQQQAALESDAKRYLVKVANGKDKFSDFDEVMKDFDAGAFPQLALLAGELDNTADIMYELSKNPDKIARLDYLANRSPALARKELGKLANSITQNDQALEDNVTTNAPLSRLKSSTVGADNGKMGLKDYKNADWLRG
jgi:hypothetical protein